MSEQYPDEDLERTIPPVTTQPLPAHAQEAVDGQLPWQELAAIYQREQDQQRRAKGLPPLKPLSTMSPTVADVDRPLQEHAAQLGGQVVVRRILAPLMERVPSIAVEPDAPRQTGAITFTGSPLRWIKRLFGRGR